MVSGLRSFGFSRFCRLTPNRTNKTGAKGVKSLHPLLHSHTKERHPPSGRVADTGWPAQHRRRYAVRQVAAEDRQTGDEATEMAKSKRKANNKAKKQGDERASVSVKGEGLIQVCPTRVRFQHSKIRPYFSGCGRSVVGTLDEIREGRLQPSDLPPIQVLVGPDADDGMGPWYFSLNNRRLWVLKQCHKEGLLERQGNKIMVRVRVPKSDSERERYSVQNCSLDAKFMREGRPKQTDGKSTDKKAETVGQTDGKEAGQFQAEKDKLVTQKVENEVSQQEASSESESEDDGGEYTNPFSALC